MTETDIKVGPIRPTTGTLARLGGVAISQLSGSGTVEQRLRQSEQDVKALQDQLRAYGQLLDQLISVPMLIASGPNHQAGVAPDPGATAGTAKFLREDSTWSAVNYFIPNPGTGATADWGNAAPTTGAYIIGSMRLALSPAAAGNIGWTCVASGTPGTWRAWGQISE